MAYCKHYNADFFDMSSADLPKFNFVLADPPMDISASDISIQGRSDIVLDFGDWDHISNYTQFVTNWLIHLNSFMQEDSVVFVWWMNWQSLTTHIQVMEKLGYVLQTIHTWHKTNPAPKFRKTTPVSSCEWLLHFVRGSAKLNWLGQNEMHNFIQSPICMGNERIRHIATRKAISKTQKPVKVLSKYIRMYADFIDVAFDPFAGVFSTGVAALQEGASSVMIERDKQVYNYGVSRLAQI